MNVSPRDLVIMVTLWASVGGLAMSHGLPEILAPIRRGRLALRIGALEVLAIPPATWLIVHLIGMPEPYAIGLILIGAAAAGPLGLVAAQIAGADTALALAFVGGLEVVNAIAVPAWTALLLPRAVAVPVGQIVEVLVVYVLVPLAAGVLVRAAIPAVAARLVRPARIVSLLGLAVVMGLVIAANISVIGPAMNDGVPLATAIIIGGSFAAAWFLTGGPARQRAAVALVVAQRGTSLALAIALTAFGDLPGVAVAVVLYAVMSTVAVPTIALVVRRVIATDTVASDAPRSGPAAARAADSN